jgi:hypothetical protein
VTATDDANGDATHAGTAAPLLTVGHGAAGHLFHDGRLAPHPPTDVVRVEDGRLLYDAGAPTLDLGAGASQDEARRHP